MGLLNKIVEVTLNSKTIKHYEDLGYEIPRRLDKKGRLTIKPSTRILVNSKDLSKGCSLKIDVECDYCGKEYKIEYHNYFRHNHNGEIYCKPCGKKILNSGENNVLWKSDKTNEEREMGRATLNNAEWIKKVLSRDNYTCQCCSEKDSIGNNLNAHHLDGWNWCIDKRYKIGNGITLCKSCHKNFHSIYGKGDNTKEQFEEWIGQAIELAKCEGELPTARKIYCIEENKIYNSAELLAEEWKLKNRTHIYDVCNHKPKSYSVRKKHLLWYDEYLNISKEEVKQYLKYNKPKKRNVNNYGELHHNSRKIICITTKKVFNCLREAGEYYDIKSYTHINKCCTGKQQTTGKLKDGTKLKWMYYDEYLLLEDSQKNNYNISLKLL